MNFRFHRFLLAIITAAVSLHCSTDKTDLEEIQPEQEREVVYIELEPEFNIEIEDGESPATDEAQVLVAKKFSGVKGYSPRLSPEEILKSESSAYMAFYMGTIFDSCNENAEMPNVSVVIKGTNIGVQTKEDGSYQLPVPYKEYNTLVFSYPGYKTRELVVQSPVCRDQTCIILIPNIALECEESEG